MSLHTAAPRGKKVRIISKNGQVVLDKFKDRNKSYVMLFLHGWIHKSNIRSFALVRGI